MEKAHDLSQKRRTLDVSLDEDISFGDMLISERTLKGLQAAGFKKPSPIQRKAIPFGRCGFDLIVQAKSGTGKTCVFSVIAMEMLVPTLEKLQVVILAPTREISVQIANVISSISHCGAKVKVEAFIGGLPFEQDKKKIAKCQIAVGAPGRVKHLITCGLMDLSAVRLFVLDEADRLMEESFRNDISYIYSKLPLNKQMIAASATFPKELERFVAEFMKKPIKVSPGDDTILIGVRQFALLTPFHPVVLVKMRNKTAALLRILSSVSFKQCLVFSNLQSWAETICDELTKEGWPAIFMNSSQTQAKRLKAFNTLKEYRCRVLLSTDLTSRGIDAENVNLVINLDLPYDGATYLHRIGRAGRYGTYGIAVTILQEGDEVENFRKLLYDVGGANFPVSLLPEDKLPFDIWETSDDRFKKLSSMFGEYRYVKRGESNKILEGREDEDSKEKREEAASIISIYHLYPPENQIVNTLEALTNDLANFDLDMDEFEIPLRRREVQDMSEVSKAIKSSLLHLKNSGWKSFYKEFESSQKRNRMKTNDSEIDRETTSSQDVSDKTDSDEDESDDDEEEFLMSSEESAARSGISESEESSEDDVANVPEIAQEYNEIMQNWCTMWTRQTRIIRNYVQYCHYWKEMLNFS